MAELVAADHDLIAGVPGIVSVLSTIFERLADRNDAAASSAAAGDIDLNRAASAFHGLTKPSISVRSYLERIFRYAHCSPSCFVVAYIYLDRFVRRHPALALDSFNVHRFLITSVLSAVKFMDDICYNNAYFAKVGGISLMEMNYLEVDFLFGIGFQLNVSPATFGYYCSILQREMYSDSSSSSSPPAAQPSRFQYCCTEEGGGEEDESRNSSRSRSRSRSSSCCNQKQIIAV